GFTVEFVSVVFTGHTDRHSVSAGSAALEPLSPPCRNPPWDHLDIRWSGGDDRRFPWTRSSERRNAASHSLQPWGDRILLCRRRSHGSLGVRLDHRPLW